MFKSFFGIKDRMGLKLRKAMGITSNTSITGKVKFTLHKANGDIESWSTNAVVKVGKEYVAGLLETGAGALMDYMELGTGTTAVSQDDDRLEIPLVPDSKRQLHSIIRNGTSITYRADWGVGEAIGMLTEAGLFNSPGLPPSSVMLCRSVFVGKNKEDTDSITVEWVITVGPS